MEINPSLTFQQTLNLFEDEESSIKHLRSLLKTPVGYNSSKEVDPFHPSFSQVRGDNKFPAWVYEFYKGYSCIDRLIILVQRNRYIRSERDKKYELVYIRGGYIVDLENNIQYKVNDPTKQR